MLVFKAVHPIADQDPNSLPVREIGPAVAFYTKLLGFTLLASDKGSATLIRGGAQIGLVQSEWHDPRHAGAFFFEVTDVDALRRELEDRGAEPCPIHVHHRDGQDYRLFFVRDRDSREADHDGYCFCFGQPVPLATPSNLRGSREGAESAARTGS